MSGPAAAHQVAGADLFPRSWTAPRTAVAGPTDEDFAQPSGGAGRLVRDLVRHLAVDAQDILITLAAPADTDPVRDAVAYRETAGPRRPVDDPLDAPTVRAAAAHQDPRPAASPPPRRRGRGPWLDRAFVDRLERAAYSCATVAAYFCHRIRSAGRRSSGGAGSGPWNQPDKSVGGPAAVRGTSLSHE
ncbi:maleylpyruvate isomerase N-terminal domain-containing protein [Streptomyces sp. NPDC057499]|uniref:maleylpyruvate isomerase N-terminal domain-containing protein n=1 Tax=Streptomyces sp. NPDC057499 TaxID=3346150 RepID=UPI0036A77F72